MNAPETLHPELPAFDNSFAALPPSFYTRLSPAPLPAPYLVGVSDGVTELLGLPAAFVDSPQFAAIFAGNALLPGSEPPAAVYSGHQFGVWIGQLGDGRTHLLGGLRNAHGHWEIQLKGAGRTPYSRGANGRAVLRSSIRVFLCSKAMAGLGVPTTRALCVIGADLPVRRETIETAAVDETSGDAFAANCERLMCDKLGLRQALPDDEAFIGQTFGFLQQHRPDFTLFFRALSTLPATVNAESRTKTDSPLRDLVVDRSVCDTWLDRRRASQAQNEDFSEVGRMSRLVHSPPSRPGKA